MAWIGTANAMSGSLPQITQITQIFTDNFWSFCCSESNDKICVDIFFTKSSCKESVSSVPSVGD